MAKRSGSGRVHAQPATDAVGGDSYSWRVPDAARTTPEPPVLVAGAHKSYGPVRALDGATWSARAGGVSV